MDLAEETIRVLRRFKNAILEGPPGTGKTFVVAQIASQWQAQTGQALGGDGGGPYAIVLHPSTTYEQFIEGLRYDEGEGQFVRKNGFLLNVIYARRSILLCGADWRTRSIPRKRWHWRRFPATVDSADSRITARNVPRLHVSARIEGGSRGREI